MAAPLRVRSSTWLMVLLPLLICGCTRKWEDAGVRHYDYTWSAAFISLMVAAALIPFGWLIRHDWERVGWTMMAFGAAGLFFTPDLFLSHVDVSDDGFVYRCGSIFVDSGDVKFNNCQQITLTTKVSRGKRGRRNTTHYMNCQLKTGTPVEIQLSTLMREALSDLDASAGRRGVPVIDMREH